MNLYSKKQKWKIALLISAVVLICFSLIYSNYLVDNLRQREKIPVKQWTETLQKKAELITLTNRTFEELKNEERENMKLWAKATEELVKPFDLNSNVDYTFYIEIIQNNKNIPVVLMDKDSTIINYLNIYNHNLDSIKTENPENAKAIINEILLNEVRNWTKTHEPIVVNIDKNQNQYVFYSDSRKIKELVKQRNDLIEGFNKEIINNPNLVPVLFLDKSDYSVIASNLDPEEIDSPEKISAKVKEFTAENDGIPVTIDDKEGIVFYKNSVELTYLKYFPVVQIIMISLFILIAYLAFSVFKKAEQNQVWAGMSKETAHQLGTPISSLMAWIQLLESNGTDPKLLAELEKDVNRLNTIADRFSKIGSETKLEELDICATIQGIVDYLDKRSSAKINFQTKFEDPQMIARYSPVLFEWVIENICKNAIDAMEGEGSITIEIHRKMDDILIDISDTGKGIPSVNFKTVFNPGYTTKKRGWGLGLSLVKRIVEEYHKGKVFVLKSEKNIGTTFRIILKA